jgi:hypothetical protein
MRTDTRMDLDEDEKAPSDCTVWCFLQEPERDRERLLEIPVK